MYYKLEEVLKKLKINKYKFDKLRAWGYINVSYSQEWNGMYYLDVLRIPKDEVNKLTPKKLEKIFSKIKKEESMNLENKWKNKVLRSNSKFINEKLSHGKEFDAYIESKKEFTMFVNSNIELDSNKFERLKRAVKLEENNRFKVRKIGQYRFDFWENPLFENNSVGGYLEPRMYRNDGSYLFANVVADVIEILNKKVGDSELIGRVISVGAVELINECCQCCNSVIRVPGAVYSYKESSSLCMRCYESKVSFDKGESYRKSLLEDKEVLIVDFETASLSSYDGIVSLSIIDMSRNVLLNTLIKADGMIDLQAKKLHGIDESMRLEAPTFLDIKETLIGIIKNKTLIFSHEFHEEFFESLLKRYGLKQYEIVEIGEDFEIKNLYFNANIGDILNNCNMLNVHSKSYSSLDDCFDMLNCIEKK